MLFRFPPEETGFQSPPDDLYSNVPKLSLIPYPAVEVALLKLMYLSAPESKMFPSAFTVANGVVVAMPMLPDVCVSTECLDRPLTVAELPEVKSAVNVCIPYNRRTAVICVAVFDALVLRNLKVIDAAPEPKESTV